jgi:hypothetical protein
MPRDREPERPRAEPEIIPPGHDERLRRAPDGVFVHVDAREGIRRVYVARPGLPAILLAVLFIGLVTAAAFFVLAGLVLVIVPLALAVIAFALLSGTIRHHWRRLQAWWAGGR